MGRPASRWWPWNPIIFVRRWSPPPSPPSEMSPFYLFCELPGALATGPRPSSRPGSRFQTAEGRKFAFVKVHGRSQRGIQRSGTPKKKRTRDKLLVGLKPGRAQSGERSGARLIKDKTSTNKGRGRHLFSQSPQTQSPTFPGPFCFPLPVDLKAQARDGGRSG